MFIVSELGIYILEIINEVNVCSIIVSVVVDQDDEVFVIVFVELVFFICVLMSI